MQQFLELKKKHGKLPLKDMALTLIFDNLMEIIMNSPLPNICCPPEAVLYGPDLLHHDYKK
jgi:hypothetical protein